VNKLEEQYNIPKVWDVANSYLIRKLSSVSVVVNRVLDGYLFDVRSITTDSDMRSYDSQVLANTTGGNINYSLLTAIQCKNKRISIKNTGTGVNTLTVTPSGAETIDGASPWSTTTSYESVDLISDGSNWFIV
jgi:hypothetical protein